MYKYKSSPFTNNSIVICKIIVGRGFTPAAKQMHQNGGSKPPPYDVNEGERYMKATGIVRRVDDLGRIVIPKEIRRTLRIREGDPSLTTLTPIDRFCWAIHSIVERTDRKY